MLPHWKVDLLILDRREKNLMNFGKVLNKGVMFLNVITNSKVLNKTYKNYFKILIILIMMSPIESLVRFLFDQRTENQSLFDSLTKLVFKTIAPN